MLTVRDALDTLLDYAGEAGDTEARRVGLALLNDAVEAIWQAHGWLDYRAPTPFELTTTSGTSRYALPAHVGKLHTPARNLTRPGVRLDPIDPFAAQECYPATGLATAETGMPRHYRLSGITGCATQPDPGGTALELVSDSASDTDVAVTLRGDDANGVQRTARLTLTATTPVDAGTWTFIDEFAKAATADAATIGASSVGTVTLRRVDTSETLQSLASYESAREHKVLQLYPTPDAAYVLAFPWQRRPQPLVSGSDPLPGDWWLAIKEEWEIRYRVNTGEIAADSVVPRPHLRKLIEDDNLLRPAPRKRPAFGWGAYR
jgi:hypothetical protein